MVDRDPLADPALARRVRAALEAEAAEMPLTVTTERLEARLASRRRAGASPSRSTLLIAAGFVALALVGVAGMAGGWFDRDPIANGASPTPNGSAAASPSVPLPSASRPVAAADSGLLSLDELLAWIPAELVETAQAHDSGSDVEVVLAAPQSISLSPIAHAGPYRLWVTCLGTSADAAVVVGGEARAPGERVVCDAELHEIDLELAARARIQVLAVEPASWRAVLERPVPAPDGQPASIAAIPEPIDETVLIYGTGGPDDGPSYDPPPASGPVVETFEFGGVHTRRSYRVVASCAGPAAIRYGIQRLDDLEDSAGRVVDIVLPCDGRLHDDTIQLALEGGVFTVRADPRVQWRVQLIGETPPIGIPADDADWQLSVGIGPDLQLDVESPDSSLSGLIQGTDRTIRVVVSCLGGSAVDVRVLSGLEMVDEVGRFRATCDPQTPATTAVAIELSSEGFIIEASPDAPMWLVVAVQERRAGG